MTYEAGKKSGGGGSAVIKFLFFSLSGVLFFFAPVFGDNTPLMYVLSSIKKMAGKSLQTLILLLTVGLLMASALNTFRILPQLDPWLGKDGKTSKILYVMAVVFGLMVYFKVGPEFIIHKETGGLALYLAASIFLTVFIAGFVVTFIASFGLLEFVGTLIEPIMRPIYKLPGYAAVDVATSIACSAAVDVFLANKIYLNKLYTKRDVAVVASNFTICSLGFFVVLCEIAKIPQYYGLVAVTSFAISFIIPIITARIPPLSRIPDEFVDGTPYTGEDEKVTDKPPLLKRAWASAMATAENANPAIVITGMGEAVFFAVKVGAYVLSVATLACAISIFTPVFDWIGMPFIPVLNMLGVPNAVEIAPSILVGITEIALPALLIAGKNVAPAAAFFIVVLSTVQVIFFTESANAIMESDIPLGFWQLIAIFLIRTVIAIPLVAAAMHMFF